MKYLTFTVPCYNSQDYMKRCIDSLLVGGLTTDLLTKREQLQTHIKHATQIL